MPQTPQDISGRTPPKLSVVELPETEQPDAEIIVYICPTPDCNDHIAAPDFRPDRSNIDKMQHVRNQDSGITHPTHNRIECPSCRIRGVRVQRVPYIVTGVLPLEKVLQAMAKNEQAKSAAL